MIRPAQGSRTGLNEAKKSVAPDGIMQMLGAVKRPHYLASTVAEDRSLNAGYACKDILSIDRQWIEAADINDEILKRDAVDDSIEACISEPACTHWARLRARIHRTLRPFGGVELPERTHRDV